MAYEANRPETVEEAFNRGKEAHQEGMNPFRNTSMDDWELNNAWLDGFESRDK